MELGTSDLPIKVRSAVKKEQEGPDHLHILLFANIAMMIFTVFWLFLSGSYYSYNNQNTASLKMVILLLNSASTTCFLISIIGSTLGVSRLLKRKYAVRLSAIPMILGLVLLINSILIYAYLAIGSYNPGGYYY